MARRFVVDGSTTTGATYTPGQTEDFLKPCLRLFFEARPTPFLSRTEFSHPRYKVTRVCHRKGGSSAAEYECSFPWSVAVRGLTVLLLRSIAFEKDSRILGGREDEAGLYLQGFEHSLAASLDYALGRKPRWITDMFGWDIHGRPLCRLLTNRINPERKRAGPVLVCLNTEFLPSDSIEVHVNDRRVRNPFVIERLAEACETRR